MTNYINSLKQSGIRSMTTKCEALGGINLGQGICDIPTPEHIRLAANEAINCNYNTYSPHQGLLQLREVILKKLFQYNHISHASIDNVLVTHGSTGGFVSVLRVLFEPGEEAILFEPFYGYHRQLLELHGVTLKTILVDVDNQFSFDPHAIEKLVNNKTRAIILCNPTNPSGKVFTINELIQIGEIATKHGLYVISDEIYEHIIYPPHNHVSIASMTNYSERVIMLSGFSKTYHITGWRVGYAFGPQDIIEKMALIHDLYYICSPTPLQQAVVTALNMPQQYYDHLIATFLAKRNTLVNALRNMGFTVIEPQGAYYLIADYANLGLPKDSDVAANLLLEKAKISTIPAKYFYMNKENSENKLRFCFAVTDQKIDQAIEQLIQYIGK